ncbi:MAG TPA: hypothetical protein VFZ35_08770, partial [Sphingomicrobium sp.]
MTLLLSRGEIAALMQPADYLEAVESAFRALGEGRAESPVPLSIQGNGGAFHAKGAALTFDAIHASLKFNANFPGNPEKGMPTVQGAILHCDGATGALLAIMDSIEVTLRRTAAASALAACYLARPESSVLTLIGCGAQASAQLDALRDVLPIATVYCADLDQARAEEFAN